MAVAYVQSNGNSLDTNSASISTSLTGVASQNLLVVAVSQGATTDTITVSDTVNTYTQIEYSKDTLDNQSLLLFYAENVTGGNLTITASWGPTEPFRRIEAVEYFGVLTSGSLDVHAKNFATSATPSVGPVTTTADNDLTVAVLNFNSAITGVDGGLILRQSQGGVNLYDRIEAAAGSDTASWTTTASANYQAIIATFKQKPYCPRSLLGVGT